MTGIEVSLLIIGCIFMVGSFFVSEKLSGAEINRLAELSDEELKRIIEKGIEKAESRIDYVIEEKVEEVAEKAEIVMERESNLKITAISEYSDTVFESMKKTHDEIMFLYSMLNDKHTEMTSLTGDLQRLAANVRNMQEGLVSQQEVVKATSNTKQVQNPEYSEPEMTDMTEVDTITEYIVDTETAYTDETIRTEENDEYVNVENHNDMILALHKEGMSKVDIARKLNLGVGEVSLVIGLYKGDEK